MTSDADPPGPGRPRRARLGSRLGDRLPAVRRGRAPSGPRRRRPSRRLGRRPARRTPTTPTRSSRAGSGTRRSARATCPRSATGSPPRRRGRRLADRHPGRPPPPDRVHPLRRRGAAGRQPRRRAGARGERRRRVRRRGHGRRLQPPPPRALPRGGVERRLDAGHRAQQGRRRRATSRASGSPPRRSRPASRSGPCPRSPATASTRCATRTSRPAGPRSCSARRASASRRSSTRSSAASGSAPAAVREDDSRGRHTTTHRELVRLPGGALLIDTPGIRSLGVAGAVGRPRPRVRRHRRPRAAVPVQRLPARGRARLRGRRRPSPTARSRADRLASHRKLEREAAHVARASDPLLRAEERRKWRAIHVSVNQHMKRKYGRRPMTTVASLAPPAAPAGSGVTYRRYRPDDLPGMAAANQRLRTHVRPARAHRPRGDAAPLHATS